MIAALLGLVLSMAPASSSLPSPVLDHAIRFAGYVLVKENPLTIRFAGYGNDGGPAEPELYVLPAAGYGVVIIGFGEGPSAIAGLRASEAGKPLPPRASERVVWIHLRQRDLNNSKLTGQVLMSHDPKLELEGGLRDPSWQFGISVPRDKVVRGDGDAALLKALAPLAVPKILR